MIALRTDMIRRDGGTQMRVQTNDEAVSAYAERLEAGDTFPPVVVFFDGGAHWLADGFHRLSATLMVAGRTLGTDAHDQWTTINADVRSGTREDAIRFAVSANRTNGLRRTNADKQMAVRAALALPAMAGMSDRAIAEEIGVGHSTVSSARQLSNLDSSSPHKAVNTATDQRTRTGLDGKTRKLPTTKAAPRLPAEADAPVDDWTTEIQRRRDTTTSAPAPTRAADPVASQHTCPTCNGKGYVE